MKPSPSHPTLLQYFRESRTNRQWLCWTVGLQILAWCIYKWCIPGTDYFPDSFSYVYAAINEISIFYRPMGYARFLSFLHGFSNAAGWIVGCQYFFLSGTALALFFSIDFLLPFRNAWLKGLSRVSISLQPLLLVIANLLAGDGIFAALTIGWVTLLIWILLRPGWWALIAQALVLWLAFQVRYNALYYPLISCLVFVMAVRAGTVYRVAGILFTVMLIGGSYHSIRTSTEEVTGANVFSGFSGWQMANNALYLSPFIDLSKENFDDPDLQSLHQCVRQFVDSISPASRREVEEGKIESAYLWDNGSPLKRYLFYYSRINRQPYLQAWYQVATLYGDYGKTLILHHPMAFCRHFLWPNTRCFVMPDAEYLRSFRNAGGPVPKETAAWFEWDSEKQEPAPRYPGLQQAIVAGYPVMHVLLTISCLLLPLAWLISRKRRKEHQDAMKLLWFWSSLFVMNMAFSILASQVVLRYECAWFVLGGGIPLCFLDRMIGACRWKPKK